MAKFEFVATRIRTSRFLKTGLTSTIARMIIQSRAALQRKVYYITPACCPEPKDSMFDTAMKIRLLQSALKAWYAEC